MSTTKEVEPLEAHFALHYQYISGSLNSLIEALQSHKSIMSLEVHVQALLYRHRSDTKAYLQTYQMAAMTSKT